MDIFSVGSWASMAPRRRRAEDRAGDAAGRRVSAAIVAVSSSGCRRLQKAVAGRDRATRRRCGAGRPKATSVAVRNRGLPLAAGALHGGDIGRQ